MIEETRCPVGIKELDQVLGGGFVTNSVNIIAGSPGTGKTIFALQFIHDGAKRYHENGLYVTLEQNIEDLKLQARQLGMDMDSSEVSKRVAWLKIDLDTSDVNPEEEIRKAAAKIKATRIVIDNLTILTYAVGLMDLDMSIKKENVSFSEMPMVKHLDLRERYHLFVNLFIKRIRKLNATTIFITEAPRIPSEFWTKDKESEFSSDLLMILHSDLDDISRIGGIGVAGYHRGMRIVKMRYSSIPLWKILPFKIGERGIEIFQKK